MNTLVAITGLVGVVVSAGAIVITLRSVRDQLRLHAFMEYTRRYSEITKRVPSQWRDPSTRRSLEALEDDERGSILNSAREYLNLCSEEFFLHDQGRIDDETWTIWTQGIVQTVGLPWIRESWDVLRPEYDYVPRFSAFIDILSQPIRCQRPIALTV